MNESQKLAQWAAELRYEDLPPHVVAKAKDLMLDQLGIMIGISTKPWSKAIYEYAQDWGTGVAESTVVHYGLKTKAEVAVFANASFGHGFEIDDHWLPGMSHPGCIVIPSVLAMAEKTGSSGRSILTAIAAGYEVMGRINKAICPSCILRGFHAPTSISGPLGAATVAGKILEFDAEQMLHALSISASHASGLIEYDQTGGSVKRVHAGMAAHGGLRSAFLAQKGITGPSTILEGKHGLCQAFADKYDLEEITNGLGQDFRVVEGTGFKAYCSVGAMHTAIDALKALVAEHAFIADDVTKITVGTNHQSITHISAKPIDITSSQFSTQYSLALTLLRDGNGVREYNEENLRDPAILSLAAKVDLYVDTECDRQYPKTRAARVTVHLKDGRTLEKKADYSKGLPENPMTREEFEGKFKSLVSIVSGEESAHAIIAFVGKLDRQSSIDPLLRLMC